MKIKYFIYIAICLSLIFSGCNDFEDNRLDFSDNYPLYVKFTNVTKKTIVEGASLNVQIESPIFTYEPITVGYEITGDINMTGEAVITSGKKAVTFAINTEDDDLAEEDKNAVVTIVSVTNGLSIGRKNLNTSFELVVTDND